MINIITNAALIPAFLQNGAVIASVFSELLTNAVQFIYMKKKVKFSINVKALMKGLISTIVMALSVYIMNMWGLTPDFLDVLEDGFKEFFEKEVRGNPLKAKYLIPIYIGKLLEQGKMSVKVLKTNDTWHGMTYHENVAAVKDSFKKMLEKGVY